jgi:hypothetical protein
MIFQVTRQCGDQPILIQALEKSQERAMLGFEQEAQEVECERGLELSEMQTQRRSATAPL